MAGRVIRVVGAVLGGILVSFGLLFLVGAVSLYRQFGPSPERARVDVDRSRPGTIRIPCRHHGSHGEILLLEVTSPARGMSGQDREALSTRLTLPDGSGAVVGEEPLTGARFRLEDLEPGRQGGRPPCPVTGPGLLVLDVGTPVPALSGKAQQATILEVCRRERR